MKTAPIVAAQIDFDDAGAPRAPLFDDIYHPPGQALGQARHVFLGGNGLPQRWAQRQRFAILEAGFGLGNNFLATWQAWRDDPDRCERLQYVAVELHPPTREDLLRAHRGCPLPTLAQQLLAAWPALTPDWHVLDFESGRLRLLLCFGDASQLLPALVAQVDAIYLDGFAPSKNPQLWSTGLLRCLSRIAAKDCTAATWSVARPVREGLRLAGFTVATEPGFGSKRDMTVARFTPRHTVQRPAGRCSAEPAPASALVIGAGLAGAGVARALSAQGVACQVVERQSLPATEGSGLPGGIFHGVIHADDGRHARWFRAAAALTARVLRPAIEQQAMTGAIVGVLRLETRLHQSQMQAILLRQRMAPELVQAVDAARASDLTGLPLSHPGWWFPAGGWVIPASMVRNWLRAPGVTLHPNRNVERIELSGNRWQAIDAQGVLIAAADVVVLANGDDAVRLAGALALPLQRLRGQITRLPATTPGLVLPRVPVTGLGYALALPDGDLLCGASSAAQDECSDLRANDHRRNLEQLARLTGAIIDVDAASLPGGVGWRVTSPDRLPVLGPVPQLDRSAGARIDQPRRVPRRPGVYIATGFGSRGITQAALAGEVVAAWITGAPIPVASDLLDAVDAARFIARAARVADQAVEDE